MKLLTEAISDIKAKKYIYLVLLLVIIFGLYLRAYGIDSPVYGYHNWKETHYLTEARNFAEHGFFANGFFVPSYDYPAMTADLSGAHADTFPFISIVVGTFFKIFGPSITIARLIDIFFSILAVPAMFLLARKLFKNTEVSLVAAFLAALAPMLVFFSHNTQLQNPGLLFMVLGAYFYMRWLENDLNSDIIWASLFVAIAGLNVLAFLVILIPIFFTFPFERLKKFTQSRLKAYGISALILATIPLWFVYMKFVAANTGRTISSIWGGGGGLVQLATLYVPQARSVILNYMADNFSLAVIAFSFVGLLSLSIMYLRKKHLFGGKIALPSIIISLILAIIAAYKLQFGYIYIGLFAIFCLLSLPVFRKEAHEKALEGPLFTEKFMLGYAIGTVAFIIILSEKLTGHAYHQFPIAPFFILLASYAFVSISSNIADFVSQKFVAKEVISEEKATSREDVFKFVKYFAIILLLLIAAYGLPGSGKMLYRADVASESSFSARARLFNTVFPGIEIAGDYISKHAATNDRILFSGGEIMGLLWHADHKGFYGIDSVATIKNAESKGVKWIVIYPPLGRNELSNSEVLKYLQENYAIKQVAVAPSGESYAPIYFVLEKGGTFNEQTLATMSSTYPPQQKTYARLGGGSVQLIYVTAEK